MLTTVLVVFILAQVVAVVVMSYRNHQKEKSDYDKDAYSFCDE